MSKLKNSNFPGRQIVSVIDSSGLLDILINWFGDFFQKEYLRIYYVEIVAMSPF